MRKVVFDETMYFKESHLKKVSGINTSSRSLSLYSDGLDGVGLLHLH